MDLDSIFNKPVHPYKDRVKEGFEYINSSNCHSFYINSYDNLKLFGRYFDKGYDKAIILMHGYRSNSTRDFACAVEMYHSMGFNVLLCDQRSHGKSEGKLITFGIKERYDVLSWCEFLNANYRLNSIVIDGMSMGATTVLLAAELDLPDNVKAIVADSGYTSPADIIKKVGRDKFTVNVDFFVRVLDVFCKIIGKFSIYDASTTIALKNSKLPVIFIHGNDDNFVPYEMSERAYNTIKERAELVLIDNADHGLGFLVDETKIRTSLEAFLKKYV